MRTAVLRRLLLLSATTVALLATSALAWAAYTDTIVRTTDLRAGTLELTITPVDGLDPLLLAEDLQPGDAVTFGHALVHTGSLPADAQLVVTEANGSEDGCTSEVELLLDDCADADDTDQGDLVDVVTLQLWSWPAATAEDCAATPPAGALLHDGPFTTAAGVRSDPAAVAPGAVLCVRGTLHVAEDAPHAAHGDGLAFTTVGEAVESDPTFPRPAPRTAPEVTM